MIRRNTAHENAQNFYLAFGEEDLSSIRVASFDSNELSSSAAFGNACSTLIQANAFVWLAFYQQWLSTHFTSNVKYIGSINNNEIYRILSISAAWIITISMSYIKYIGSINNGLQTTAQYQHNLFLVMCKFAFSSKTISLRKKKLYLLLACWMHFTHSRES